MIEIFEDQNLKSFPRSVESLRFSSTGRNRKWRIALTAALLMTLMQGEWLWTARVGWTLLAVLFALDIRHAFYALFFFAPWFHPAGFMPNSFFSLKHFHVAFFIAFAVQCIQDNPVRTLVQGIKTSGRSFYPVLLILAIGIFNFLRFDRELQAIRSPANLFLILLAVFYILGILQTLRGEQGKMIKHGMMFYTGAVVLQILIALQNTIAGTDYFGTPLIHNNHLGILCGISIFFALALFFTEKKKTEKQLFAVSSLIMASALLASCSRTAWLSFLVSLIFFLVLAYRRYPAGHDFRMRKRYTVIAVAALGFLIVLISSLNPAIGNRVRSLPQLFDGSYWQFTFNDCQNFGFLGIFRLLQVYALNDILRSQPLLGIGFTRQIVDFHGFYFCVLGATGVTGLIIFSFFVRQMLTNLLKQIKSKTENPDTLFFLKVGSFCAFLSWLMSSYMETYFVQFSPWIAMLLAATLSYPNESRESSARPA